MELMHSLLAVMVVVWVMGKIFRMLSLPIIFGELVGGIIVGPLMLGIIDPESATIKILAELGVFFLMLHTGLETDPHTLLTASRKSILIAIGGVIVPFLSGFFLALAFGQEFAAALFIGLGLSITAIAITARLFKDYKIHKTDVAHITLGAAVLDDVIAMMLFSIVLSIIKTGSVELVPVLLMLLKTILFFGIVIIGGFAISKHIAKILEDKGFTFSLIVALGLGLIAEMIGLHMVIGAFLAGLFIREEIVNPEIFRKIEDRFYGLSYSFLGPIFFASLAFHLDFSSVITQPLFLIVIILVAILGKVIGSGGVAMLQKVTFHKALIIGLSMNSRGAMELIIASIGLKNGVITNDVFSILVIMAFVTTLISIFAMRPLAHYAKEDILHKITD